VAQQVASKRAQGHAPGKKRMRLRTRVLLRVAEAGNAFKFDFDFGAHGASGTGASTDESHILGPLTAKRCAGPGGALSQPDAESPFTCRDSAGQAAAALSGSLIFSQVC